VDPLPLRGVRGLADEVDDRERPDQVAGSRSTVIVGWFCDLS
jgi:hypothetical protein